MWASSRATKGSGIQEQNLEGADIYLCDELEFKDLGAVVHYNPRAGWNSKINAVALRVAVNPPLEATDAEWIPKKAHIQSIRLPALFSGMSRIPLPLGMGMKGVPDV